MSGLTKNFQGQRAVDGLSLSLERGEVLALLGVLGGLLGKAVTLLRVAFDLLDGLAQQLQRDHGRFRGGVELVGAARDLADGAGHLDDRRGGPVDRLR